MPVDVLWMRSEELWLNADVELLPEPTRVYRLLLRPPLAMAPGNCHVYVCGADGRGKGK